MVEKVATKTISTVRVQGIIYKAVVQTVLIYGIKIWVVIGAIFKVLEGFHHWVARSNTEKSAQCTTGREWERPPVSGGIYTAGLLKIKE